QVVATQNYLIVIQHGVLSRLSESKRPHRNVVLVVVFVVEEGERVNLALRRVGRAGRVLLVLHKEAIQVVERHVSGLIRANASRIWLLTVQKVSSLSNRL